MLYIVQWLKEKKVCLKHILSSSVNRAVFLDGVKIILLWIIPGEEDVDCFLRTKEAAAAADLVGDGSDRFGELTPAAAAGLTGFIIVVIIIGNLFGCLCGWCVVAAAASGPSLVSLWTAIRHD